MAILQTRELKKYYGAGDTLVKALDGVELSVENGEFVAIIGTSGSGKSTMLHMLGGLDRPTSGTVTVDGRELSTLKDEELTIFRRRKIGFVFQAYNLVPVLSVYENIVLPIQLDGGAVDESYVRQAATAPPSARSPAHQMSLKSSCFKYRLGVTLLVSTVAAPRASLMLSGEVPRAVKDILQSQPSRCFNSLVLVGQLSTSSPMSE